MAAEAQKEHSRDFVFGELICFWSNPKSIMKGMALLLAPNTDSYHTCLSINHFVLHFFGDRVRVCIPDSPELYISLELSVQTLRLFVEKNWFILTE